MQDVIYEIGYGTGRMLEAERNMMLMDYGNRAKCSFTYGS